jgi:methyl-accepting chemotaxis protein
MTFSIRTKVASIGIVSSVVLVVALVATATVAGRSYGADVEGIVGDQTRSEIAATASATAGLVAAQSQSVALKVSNDLNVARNQLVTAGGASLSADSTWSWTAVDQFTKEEVEVDLPQMLVGADGIPQASDFGSPLPVVDDTYDLVGGTTTIFQRMNTQGDMLRVATTVEKLDGSRAVGTYIPAVNPDGTDNVVVASVLSGETYRGIAYVVNAWYVTVYEPILDGAGQVIGILYQGEKQQNLDIMRSTIEGTVIGERGYVAVLGGLGDDAGQYIISRGGEFDGESLLEVTDTDGSPIFQDLVAAAVELEPGEILTVEATWQHPGDTEAAGTFMDVTYFAPWDWIIVSNAYVADYAGPIERVEAGVGAMTRLLLVVGGIVMVLGWVGASLAARRLGDPISRLAAAARRIGQGDVNVEITHRGQDEIGVLAEGFRDIVHRQKEVASAFALLADGDLNAVLERRSEDDLLAVAFGEMVEELNAIVAHAQSVSSGIVSAARALDDASRMSIRAIAEVADNTTAVAGRIEEQAAMSTEVSETVRAIGTDAASSAEVTDQAVTKSTDATGLAADGGRHLDAAVEAMGAILEVMSGAQEAADALSRHSRQVEEAVGFIRDIAEQTNLLALNAAIEAARAGEAGRGFAVVATEVKQLAEEAATSTTRVAGIVGQMRDMTSRVVEAVDSGRAKVEDGNHVMREAGRSFEEIGTTIEQLAGQFHQVGSSSRSISDAIQSIERRMEALQAFADDSRENAMSVAAASEETAASAEEIGSVAADLVDKGSTLSAAVSRFRLRG